MQRIARLLWPLSVALIAIMIGLLGAGAASAQDDADDPAAVEAGMEVYAASCAGCHGADGEGSDRGRPLDGIADQGARSVHIQSVTDGKGGMPAFGGTLSEDEISDAVSYVRLTFVAQEDDADEEEALEELPRTGTTSTIAFIGVALLSIGAAVELAGRRRFFSGSDPG